MSQAATSFPFLAIARSFGVPYADVLAFVQACRNEPDIDALPPVPHFAHGPNTSAYYAFLSERERREAVEEAGGSCSYCGAGLGVDQESAAAVCAADTACSWEPAEKETP